MEEGGPKNEEPEIILEEEQEEDREIVYELLEQINALSPANRAFLMELLKEQATQEDEEEYDDEISERSEDLSMLSKASAKSKPAAHDNLKRGEKETANHQVQF